MMNDYTGHILMRKSANQL